MEEKATTKSIAEVNVMQKNKNLLSRIENDKIIFGHEVFNHPAVSSRRESHHAGKCLLNLPAPEKVSELPEYGARKFFKIGILGSKFS
ncbi:hypothetical protein PoB_001883800 [Plakobranchus ocellatus]|uniref:Uncharacterized protein n=1 Tax=Plakobranchus ocellatus TaxID=259542 RepID=A0AAV3ZD07_9GAST|nr:hypothetical protein PoB_001883800 [Plakobranchus ocellatus]